MSFLLETGFSDKLLERELIEPELWIFYRQDYYVLKTGFLRIPAQG